MIKDYVHVDDTAELMKASLHDGYGIGYLRGRREERKLAFKYFLVLIVVLPIVIKLASCAP